MKKKIVICGDSFAYGIGCVNLATQPFGVVTAEHFNWELIRLARGSASNYSVFLQAMFAADMEEPPHLVIISKTSHDRVEWIAEGTADHKSFDQHSLLNVNYHLYPPHHQRQPHHSGPMDFYLKDNPGYDPHILTEQVGGIDDCVKVRQKQGMVEYYRRMDTEPSDKLQLIVDYHVRISSHNIRKNYDIGLFLQAYTYLKSKGINVIMMTEDTESCSKFMKLEDVMYQDWGVLSLKYPDTIKSMHTSEEGHADTATRLIQKIKDLKID